MMFMVSRYFCIYSGLSFAYTVNRIFFAFSGRLKLVFQTTLFIPQSLKRFNHGFGIFRFGNGTDDGE